MAEFVFHCARGETILKKKKRTTARLRRRPPCVMRRGDDLHVQPGDRGRTGTRRRLLARLGRETTTTSSPAWCLIGRRSSRLACLLASLFLRTPFLSFSFYELLSLTAYVHVLLSLSLGWSLPPLPPLLASRARSRGRLSPACVRPIEIFPSRSVALPRERTRLRATGVTTCAKSVSSTPGTDLPASTRAKVCIRRTRGTGSRG